MCRGETARNTQANTQNMHASTIYDAWQNMSKQATTCYVNNSGLGMVMDVNGVYFWVSMMLLGSKDMACHKNGAWGATGGRCG